MREQVVRFGSNNNLVGIFTEPKAEHRILGIPGAIMWNVGIHHRVGPNRVYVDLCRKLANQGYSSLRFDASGLGDSEASRAESGSDNERACLDVQAAMNLMAERTKHSQVILVSFCSGTDSAHAVASSDSRVAGLVCIEGYRFPTRGYYARYATRALDIGVWKRFVRRRMPQLIPPELREPKTQSQAGQEQVFVRDYISLAQLRIDIRAMSARGTRLLFLYAGRDSSYRYQSQIYDALGGPEFRRALDVEFYPEADHLFFIQAHRDKLLDDIVRWTSRTFPGSPIGPESSRLAESAGLKVGA